MGSHQPVLFKQVLEALAIAPNGLYVDGTYGRGGHSAGMLERLGDQGRLLALDRDPQAVADGMQRFAADSRFSIRHASFADLEAVLETELGDALVDGVLLDLGVSSPQLDRAERGFSMRRNGPLDMRFDPGGGVSAAEWLAEVDEADLRRVLRRYGEEPQAKRIAAAIVQRRAEAPLTRTAELAELVAACVRSRRPGHHPATRTFQAIRIFINDELEALTRALDAALGRLRAGGRLVVISFHSLEDRIVKRFMRRHSQPDPVYRGLPDIPPHARPRLRLVGGALRAEEAEIAANPRSRSATLRAAECLISA